MEKSIKKKPKTRIVIVTVTVTKQIYLLAQTAYMS